MYTLNQLTLTGFTGNDAEAHYTPNGTRVVTLSLATKNRDQNCLTRRVGLAGIGLDANAEPEGADSCIIRFGIAFTFGPAFGSVELSDRVGAYLCNAMPDAVALVFSRAHRTLHHHVRTLR